MTEAGTIATTPTPRTRASLAADLRGIGIAPGNVLLVHSSLSALGWIAGGPVAVIEALLEIIGPTGTLVMPAHTGHLTEPSTWQHPPVPADWVDTLRAETPAFDARTTPTRAMGAIAELFRTWPGAYRSNHPTSSFAAFGPAAEAILSNHQLTSPLGEQSPLARLYDRRARVLLLGVGFNRCTALHLAEQRAWPDMVPEKCGSPIMVDSRRQWVEYLAPGLGDSDQYDIIGEELLAAGIAARGTVGSAATLLCDMREMVDFAERRWAGRPTGVY